MSALTASKPENISNLLVMDQEYPAPEIVARNAIQKNWLAECNRAQKDPERFWGEYASTFTWSRKWEQVLEWDGVHHKWFTGAKTNITVNAAIVPPSSGWAKTAASVPSPTGSFTAWSAASPTD
jgi:hypothetical protein